MNGCSMLIRAAFLNTGQQLEITPRPIRTLKHANSKTRAALKGGGGESAGVRVRLSSLRGPNLPSLRGPNSVSARMGCQRIQLRAVVLALSFSLSHAVDVTLHYDMARAVSFVCLLAAAFSTGVSRGWPSIRSNR